MPEKKKREESSTKGADITQNDKNLENSYRLKAAALSPVLCRDNAHQALSKFRCSLSTIWLQTTLVRKLTGIKTSAEQ